MSLRISNRSTVLAQRRFYNDTYLTDYTGHVWLFVVDAAEVRGPSGRVQLRIARDVVEFDSSETMVKAIEGGDWRECPEDRDWKPRLSQLVAQTATYT